MLDNANHLKKAGCAERQITLKERIINSNNSAVFFVLGIKGSK